MRPHLNPPLKGEERGVSGQERVKRKEKRSSKLKV
jgi:hypothetical protein